MSAEVAGRSLSAQPERRSALRALRVHNFRLYASGQMVSATGTWMQRVAQDWLVLELTGSGTALGITTAFQFGPTLVLGLWAGVLADRFDKRRLLIVTQASMGLMAAVMGVLAVTGVVQLWQVFVLALLLGCSSAIDTPARQAFVVDMVGRNDLVNALALNSIVFNVARVIGPLIAGLTINAVGTGWAFIANFVSSSAVVGALVLMRTSELSPATPVERAPGQLREAMRYVRSQPTLWATVALMSALSMFGFNFQFTTALLAKLTFHRDAASYGLMSAALAVGAMAGATTSAWRMRTPGLAAIFTLAGVFAVAEIVTGVMPTYLSAMLMMVPTGAAMTSLAVTANMTIQLRADPSMRGRATGLYYMAYFGGTFVGAPIVGAMAQQFGARWGIIGGGLMCLIALGCVSAALCRVQGVGLGTMSMSRREVV